MSNSIVGPYERVLRELDDVLSGQKKDHIGTRKNDELFGEMVKRINALIK